jgi:flavorubredoxin
MSIIKNNLHQFSTYVPQINLSFHQYLLLADKPVLVHTGNILQAKELLPNLKAALNGVDLVYIFVSHFEADECGGLSIILEQFPNTKVICSEVTARQLTGFGIKAEVIVKESGEKLTADNYELEFITYPSEMHLWDGLLVIENREGIFFSSDLMMSFGEQIGTIKESNWEDEVGRIKQEQIPDNQKREQLQEALLKFNPKFIAAGHGACLKLD